MTFYIKYINESIILRHCWISAISVFEAERKFYSKKKYKNAHIVKISLL